MTWERAALLMIGFIVGVALTIGAGLFFTWRQKKALRVPTPRGRG